MIDINNPNSEYIFKACGFLDRLKNYTCEYILQSFEERQEIFGKMTSECDELILFSKKNFKNQSNEIEKLTNEVKLEIQKLKSIKNKTDENNCTVCNAELKTIDTLIKDKDFRYITICGDCPNKIVNLLNKLEEPTGVMWI
ncbi:DksA C4-type domain-containing protein [Flavobacterium branchiophilum]|uniref:Uncharacterized protein n=1 Tax=Flavobacterium branchiophilum (strain FL-15) TaxID=1034807 RepID=G2Z6X7_FLABF|nr:hypothetical protein [Flavobacterium branchiophilum]CCB68975.1 Hypothetical protein FBFL15_0873 [Flavobacterium branchiophilum FL-15]CCB68980.1 Hypothetical protein FBFL15_0878 [Flavobacterium branchiophilum FL-15]